VEQCNANDLKHARHPIASDRIDYDLRSLKELPLNRQSFTAPVDSETFARTSPSFKGHHSRHRVGDFNQQPIP